MSRVQRQRFRTRHTVLMTNIGIKVLRILTGMRTTQTKTNVTFAARPATVTILIFIKIITAHKGNRVTILRVRQSVILPRTKRISISSVILVNLPGVNIRRTRLRNQATHGNVVRITPAFRRQVIRRIKRRHIVRREQGRHRGQCSFGRHITHTRWYNLTTSHTATTTVSPSDSTNSQIHYHVQRHSKLPALAFHSARPLPTTLVPWLHSQ